jgi:hypothetical protein
MGMSTDVHVIVGNLTTRAVSKVGTFFASFEKFTRRPNIASHSVAVSESKQIQGSIDKATRIMKPDVASRHPQKDRHRILRGKGESGGYPATYSGSRCKLMMFRGLW